MAKDIDFTKKIKPTMGWSSWNYSGVGVNEADVMKQMNAMVARGLVDAGYEYVNIDDCWQKGRDPVTGRVNYSKERFPNGMKYIVDEAHKRGLKAGIYSDGGDNTCASSRGARFYGRNVGLWKHEEDLWMYLGDGTYMDKYARETGADPVECWGYDFIKVDWCGGRDHSLDPETQYTLYGDIIKQIEQQTGKGKIFNICCWGYNGPWMQRVGDYWRCGGDLDCSGRDFNTVIGAFEVMKRVGRFSIPGHYADPDMLIVGMHLTPEEDRSHFAMWCMFSVPLVLGCDMEAMREDTLELVTNRELIDLNNDELAHCAVHIKTLDGDVELWFKKTKTYEGGDGAIALFNRSNEERTVTLPLSLLCNSGSAYLRNIIDHVDIGQRSEITVTLPAHDTIVFTLKTLEGFTKEDFGVASEDEEFPYSDHQRIKMVTALQYIKENDAILIDVRTPEEYAQDHLEGAINIEYTKLASSPHLLPKDKMAHIIVYCSGGSRSKQAHTELRRLKYLNVFDVGNMYDPPELPDR